MNIHFDNLHLLKELNEATLGKIIVGSHMYGLNNEESDIDILYIYNPSPFQLINPFKNHHQFQYKEGNTDHLYVDLPAFIQNIVTGDSTINFEVINSPKFKEAFDESLHFLADMSKSFYTYNVAKAYLGFAKRDLKQSRALRGREMKKKLVHIHRSIVSARQIMYNNEFDMRFGIINSFYKNNESHLARKATRDKLYREMNDLRSELQDMHDNRLIKRYMSVKDQSTIHNKLSYIYHSKPQLADSTMLGDMLMQVYNANENPNFKYDN